MIKKIIIGILAFLLCFSLGFGIPYYLKARPIVENADFYMLQYKGMQNELKSAKLNYEYRVLALDEGSMVEIRRLKKLLEDQRQTLDEAKVLQEELREQLEAVWGKEGLTDFANRDQLLKFLLEDDTDKLPYKLTEWVCSDYVFLLMRNAAQQGFRLYPVLVYNITGYGEITSAHLMCLAVAPTYIDAEKGIQKALYLVEPQTDEIWGAGLLYDESSWVRKIYPFLP